MVRVKHKDETVEIENLDDLYRIVKEVRSEDEPLILIVDGVEETVAPAPRRRRRRTAEERRKADEEAFMSAFGSWKGQIDPDEFKRQVRESRGHRRSDERDTTLRPTPEQIASAMSAAGALKGYIDAEQVKAEIKQARSSKRKLPGP